MLDVIIMKVNSAKILKEIERLGWSKAKLADQIGMTRQAVGYILNRNIAKIETLNKIGKVLGLDPRDLLI